MTYNKTFNVASNYQLTIHVFTLSKSAILCVDSKPMLNPISGEMETKHFGSVSLDNSKSMNDVNFEIFRNIFKLFGETINRQQVKKIDEFLNQIKED